MSARSMTGFARVRRTIGPLEATVSVKSVNHRGLDVHFHMPAVLDPFEPIARAAVKEKMDRGHVQVHIALERQAAKAAENGDGLINVAALERWAHAYREAARILNSPGQPDPGEGLRAPGVLQAESGAEWSEALRMELTPCFAQALGELNAFRETEGAAIAAEMKERADRVLQLAGGMEEIRSKATSAFQSRLKEKLGELLRGASIDPQRLAHEAAILAERSDISEEIMRLRAHAAQLLALLAAQGEKGKSWIFFCKK